MGVYNCIVEYILLEVMILTKMKNAQLNFKIWIFGSFNFVSIGNDMSLVGEISVLLLFIKLLDLAAISGYCVREFL
jgi:hypothetical protein